MVETLYGRHHNEQQAEQGYGKALDQQNVFLYAVGVGLLEEGRQITCFAHCEDTFGRTCHPGQHACQHTECQSHGDDRRQPRSMDILEVIIKAYQQTLCQVDVLFGNDDPQCEGAEHEDDHGDSRTDEYGFRIVLGRIFHVFYVDTAHFHTGIEQEDAGSQYQVVEVAEVGEEVAVKVHLALSAGSKVNHRQHHQQAGRNDRTYHTAYFGHFAYPAHAFQRNEGGQPVDNQDHRQ